jgi:hypothetical protein
MVARGARDVEQVLFPDLGGGAAWSQPVGKPPEFATERVAA